MDKPSNTMRAFGYRLIGFVILGLAGVGFAMSSHAQGRFRLTGAAPGTSLFFNGFEAIPAICGDGLVHSSEACDDGNTVDETACAYGVENCSACSSTCAEELDLTGPICGDAALNTPFETCDDGNTVSEGQCAYGIMSCTSCSSTCTQEQLTGPVCGDAEVNLPFEACDDGNTVDETTCPDGVEFCTACSSTCAEELALGGWSCGDGEVSPNEQCDDGNIVNEECAYGVELCSFCSSICTLELLNGPVCGDAEVNVPFETCDDGNTVDETACAYGVQTCTSCSSTCAQETTLTGPFCGDSVVNPLFGEACDDGNVDACGTCDAACNTSQIGTAFGYILAIDAADLVDGETFTLNDGNQSQVFEFDFDSTVSPGNIGIALTGAAKAIQVATQITQGINNASLLIYASSGSALVHLTHQRSTLLGDQPILETVADSGFEVWGMVGGAGGDCASGTACASDADCASGTCNQGLCD